MSTYSNFCNQLTNQLFTLIDEHDSLLKWQKNWQVLSCPKLPKSIHGYYRGINLLSLLMEQQG